MRKLFLLIAAVVVVVTACRAEVNLSIDVADDGSTVATVEIGADEEFQELLGSGGGDPTDLLDDGFDLENGEAYTRTEGDMTFWGARATFDSFEELSTTFADPNDPDSAFSAFSFTADDSGATLEATLSAPEDELATDDIPFDPSQITADIFSVNFIFGMPGTVVEHNADRVLEDGRLLWEIPLTGGEKQVFARSETGSSSLWWLWIILIVVLVAGVVAAIVAVVVTRNQSKQAIAAAQTTEPAAASAPEPPASAAPEPPGDAAGEPGTETEGDAPPAAEPDDMPDLAGEDLDGDEPVGT